MSATSDVECTPVGLGFFVAIWVAFGWFCWRMSTTRGRLVCRREGHEVRSGVCRRCMTWIDLYADERAFFERTDGMS